MVEGAEVFCPLLETCAFTSVWLHCNLRKIQELGRSDPFRNRVMVWFDYICQVSILSLKKRIPLDMRAMTNEWQEMGPLYDTLMETGMIRHMIGTTIDFYTMHQVLYPVLFDRRLNNERFARLNGWLRGHLTSCESPEHMVPVLLKQLEAIHTVLHEDIKTFYVKARKATDAVFAQATLFMHRTRTLRHTRQTEMLETMQQLAEYFRQYEVATSRFSRRRSVNDEKYARALLEFLTEDFDPVHAALVMPNGNVPWTPEFEVIKLSAEDV